MSDTLKLLLKKEPPLGWIIFNQPEKRNAVSQEMWQLMPDYVHDLATDEAIRVVILRGAGDKAFAAGLKVRDLKETLRNILDWDRGRRATPLKAGMPPEKEARLLASET